MTTTNAIQGIASMLSNKNDADKKKHPDVPSMIKKMSKKMNKLTKVIESTEVTKVDEPTMSTEVTKVDELTEPTKPTEMTKVDELTEPTMSTEVTKVDIVEDSPPPKVVPLKREITYVTPDEDN